jgi:Transposase DDE domain group 1
MGRGSCPRLVRCYRLRRPGLPGWLRRLSGGLVRWRPSRAVHDAGKTVLDLAVAVALGGDCLADAGVLRAEPALFGLVASDPVISRLVTRLAGDARQALQAIRKLARSSCDLAGRNPDLRRRR